MQGLTEISNRSSPISAYKSGPPSARKIRAIGLALRTHANKLVEDAAQVEKEVASKLEAETHISGYLDFPEIRTWRFGALIFHDLNENQANK